MQERLRRRREREIKERNESLFFSSEEARIFVIQCKKDYEEKEEEEEEEEREIKELDKGHSSPIYHPMQERLRRRREREIKERNESLFFSSEEARIFVIQCKKDYEEKEEEEEEEEREIKELDKGHSSLMYHPMQTRLRRRRTKKRKRKKRLFFSSEGDRNAPSSPRRL